MTATTASPSSTGRRARKVEGVVPERTILGITLLAIGSIVFAGEDGNLAAVAFMFEVFESATESFVEFAGQGLGEKPGERGEIDLVGAS